jgi:hypothetical protein
VDQLQDPRTQQPDGNQQKQRGVQPGASVAEKEQNDSRKNTERAERWIEGASDSERNCGAEGGRAGSRAPRGADESGRDKRQQNVRDDGAEASACDRCGQGRQ